MIDITNQKYGRLLVLKEAERKNGKRAFLCQCDCGKQKVILMSDLRSGKTQSCGCLRNERIKKGKQQYIEKNQIDITRGIDLTGQKFGKLTVLEIDKEETLRRRTTSSNKKLYWKCKCDCGNIITTVGTSLRNGSTKSCGCLQKEIAKSNIPKIQPLGALARRRDLTNQKFGLLTAISINEEETKNKKRVMWNCICDCGNSKIVLESSLINGSTQSCGCLKNSKGEYYIEKILKENNIPYLKEVKFQDLKDKTYLRFDFALLNQENQIIKLIEFDGKQHYDPTSFWHTQKVIIHDQMKDNYCKEHNLQLLRINKLEDIKIENFLI